MNEFVEQSMQKATYLLDITFLPLILNLEAIL